MSVPGAGQQRLQIAGERSSGQDVRSQNVTAVAAIANIVKTSLGPVGLDKMLVDDIGDVTVTNDGATILKLLEVQHPAAKVREAVVGESARRRMLLSPALMEPARAARGGAIGR